MNPRAPSIPTTAAFASFEIPTRSALTIATFSPPFAITIARAFTGSCTPVESLPNRSAYPPSGTGRSGVMSTTPNPTS